MSAPLAERMRPRDLSEFINQKHLVGEKAPIRTMLKMGTIASMIFWGPPGTGKTTLAEIIAHQSGRTFYPLSAIQSGVKDVREAISKAQNKNLFSDAKAPIVFIDEIHRFNKGQQDALLSAVEKGEIVLIGATTENPSFELVNALLSRCQVYQLHELNQADLTQLIHRAIAEDVHLKKKQIQVKSIDLLLRFSGGDARKLLNALEMVVNSTNASNIVIEDAQTEPIIQNNLVHYDKSGEMHYDIISAFIKSIRGSDPQAAVYWLARMVEGGEDVKFIARRMIILASEDIGNANPTALIMANNCFQAANVIGYPEARIILSQCAIYLANSPKSNSTYMAIKKAQAEVKSSGNLPVPLHLRNAPTPLMKQMDYGKGYQYPHDFNQNFIIQNYLPESLKDTKFYIPANNARETKDLERLSELWKDKYQE